MSTPSPSDEAAMQASQSSLQSKPQSVKSSENTGPDDHVDTPGFPEGGFTAWGTALGAWIGSVNAFLILSVGLVSGRMVDRGAFYPVMKIGCLLQCFFLFMLSLAKPNGYYQASLIFLSQGIGLGIAIGLTNVPSIAVVSHHFQQRRALAMGIVVAGASLGAILHPILLNNLINEKLGFANGVRASASLISGLLFIAILLMRTRLPPQPKAVSYTRVLQNSSRDGAYICACVGMATYEVGFFFEAFYLQLDSALHGLGQDFRFIQCLSIFHSGSFIGRLTAGAVSAYVGIPNMVVGTSLISSAVIFGMIGLHSAASVALEAVSYGFFAGGLSTPVVAMMGPLISYLTPEISDIGARMGIMFAIGGIGSLVGTYTIYFYRPSLMFSLGAPICGAFLTSHYIWWRPAVFAGSVAIGGTIMFACMQVILKMRQKTSGVCSKEAGV
ncbi:major facilitator superfamily domain-containing protein [Suillus lakei]|nr:major facilitator superfamily domain-containing protein [Suillus lakei]